MDKKDKINKIIFDELCTECFDSGDETKCKDCKNLPLTHTITEKLLTRWDELSKEDADKLKRCVDCEWCCIEKDDQHLCEYFSNLHGGGYYTCYMVRVLEKDCLNGKYFKQRLPKVVYPSLWKRFLNWLKHEN